jgi:hypothetical protein
MTPRSFFLLALRITGIFLLTTLCTDIIEFVISIWGLVKMSSSSDLWILFFSLIKTLIIMAMGYWLIFKTENIIDSFGLDKGFNESTFNFNWSSDSIFRVALIISGAVVLFNEIPNLCRIGYNLLFQRNAGYLEIVEPDWSPLIFSIVKIILAVLIIGERKRIIDFLVKENKNDPFRPENSSDLRSR